MQAKGWRLPTKLKIGLAENFLKTFWAAIFQNTSKWPLLLFQKHLFKGVPKIVLLKISKKFTGKLSQLITVLPNLQVRSTTLLNLCYHLSDKFSEFFKKATFHNTSRYLPLNSPKVFLWFRALCYQEVTSSINKNKQHLIDYWTGFCSYCHCLDLKKVF